MNVIPLLMVLGIEPKALYRLDKVSYYSATAPGLNLLNEIGKKTSVASWFHFGKWHVKLLLLE